MVLFDYLKSTLLSKVVMAVTGVILCLFVIGHCIGNMQVFIGQETFNRYAHFLQGLGELLWVIRIVLLLSLILHIITSIRVKLLNYQAKGQKYEVKRYVKATLTGRTMMWTGILVFIFLVFHLLHFTVGVIDSKNFSKNNTEYYSGEIVIAENEADEKANDDNPEKCNSAHSDCNNCIHYKGKCYNMDDDMVLYSRPDAYLMVIKSFKQPLYTITYIIFVIIVGFHLSHAIQSAFQTLGLNHPKYNRLLRALGPVLSTIVVICYISIPIAVIFGLVGGGL